MEGTEIHSSNSLLDHVYLLQQQNYTGRKRRFSAKSCSFGQLCFKLTYNGSIVGFFTKPEFSQFLHQVFSNITNHQRFTLQKGNSRGEGLIREIFLVTLKKKIPCHAHLPTVLMRWNYKHLSEVSEHILKPEKPCMKASFKNKKLLICSFIRPQSHKVSYKIFSYS